VSECESEKEWRWKEEGGGGVVFFIFILLMLIPHRHKHGECHVIKISHDTTFESKLVKMCMGLVSVNHSF
jgi:hypothetical protein